MITYTWLISQLERQQDSGGIVTAYWRVNVSDDQLFETSYGSVNFKPNPTSESFIPFEQLTEEIILVWVWNHIEKDSIEATLAQQIALQKNPPTLSGLPWV